jgi:hypothetical protein
LTLTHGRHKKNSQLFNLVGQKNGSQRGLLILQFVYCFRKETIFPLRNLKISEFDFRDLRKQIEKRNEVIGKDT